MSNFVALMWKLMLVRKREYMMTILEIIIPILLLLPILGLKYLDQKSSENFRRISLKTSRIMYTPDSKMANVLMGEVGKVLYLPRFQTLPKNYGRSFASANHTQDDRVFKLMNSLDAVISFENLNGDSLPPKLNYTVHLMKKSKKKSLINSPYENSDDFDESFLSLQWAIDSSFIKMKAGPATKLQNITIKEFLRWKTDPYVKLSALEYDDFIFLTYIILFTAAFHIPMVSFVFVILRLTEEKSSGIRELVKMYGVSQMMLDVTYYLDALLPCLINSVFGAIIMYYTPIGAHILILFLGLFLYQASLVTLAFFCSTINWKGQNVASTAVFTYLAVCLLGLLVGPCHKDHSVLVLKGLMPHVPQFWYLYQLMCVDKLRAFLDFNYWSLIIPKTGTILEVGSVKMSIEMQLVQIVILFLLSCYMGAVIPRKYGVTLPWNFPCRADFWVKSTDYIPKSGNYQYHQPTYERYFEDPPENLDVIVEVVNLKKSYSSKRSILSSITVLNNISLKFYRGEVTVIVGPNGAGKSTLISIIAGMVPQTSGKVFIDRLDTSKHLSQLRRHIIFCPKNTILFPKLTVQEHLIFFSMITKKNLHEAKKAAEHIMTQMELIGIASSSPRHLSVGMLRRLQLGCTLCSDATLLLLDAPTEGLDVEARKDLWKTIYALRETHTVIMTTNSMEEADLLADRIVGLQWGNLRCCATPLFLKMAVGSGLRIALTTFQSPDLGIITRMLQGTVPDTTLNTRIVRTLLFEVPPGSDMSALLNDIEANKATLDIESLRVGSVSLEEAILKLCADEEVDVFKERELALKDPDEYTFIDGWPLIKSQILELFKRQIDFSYSKFWTFIIFHLFAPFILSSVTTLLTNERFIRTTFNMHYMYRDGSTPFATYDLKTNLSRRRQIVEKLKVFFPQLKLHEGQKDDPEFTKYRSCNCMQCSNRHIEDSKSNKIIEIYVDDHRANLNYDRSYKRSATIGLNMLSNIMATQHLENVTEKTITMQLSQGSENVPVIYTPKNAITYVTIAAFNVIMICGFALNDLTLTHEERVSNTRYLHFLAGCSPAVYWMVTLLYHTACYTLMHCLGVVIAVAIFDHDLIFNNRIVIMVFIVTLVVCGIDLYVFAYFLSLFFSEKYTCAIIVTLLVYPGTFAPVYMYFAHFAFEPDATHYFLDKIGTFVPLQTVMDALIRMVVTAAKNAWCYKMQKYCSQTNFVATQGGTVCCDRSRVQGAWINYFAFTDFGMRSAYIAIFLQIVFFSVMVMFVEYRVLSKMWNNSRRRWSIVMPRRKYESADVAAEKEYITHTIMQPKETIKEAILVSRLWKIYSNMFKPRKFVLKDLNFSVRKGECFGLVGINECGKTTAFKVITNLEPATRGTLYTGGYFAYYDMDMYLKAFGYGPQTLSMDKFRTGGANLNTLMVLRGIDFIQTRIETAAWLKILGLERFAHVTVGEYSNGLWRRLGVGGALCGGRRCPLLDDPTAGVDVAGQRQLWETLEQALSSGRSLVLASHNMTEVEYFCNQLTILDAGEMGALGSSNSFRKTYAPGHTVVIKLRANAVSTPAGGEKLQALKDYMSQEFRSSILKEEYLAALRFSLTDHFGYNSLHNRLSRLMTDYSEIVEDYSAFDSNFEDAFTQFLINSRFFVKPKQTW